jgi:hypothetical protein
MDNDRLQTLYLRISVDQYHFLKFILEGYDGLVLLSKKELDIVILRYPSEMMGDLIGLLSSIEKRICLSGYFEKESVN